MAQLIHRRVWCNGTNGYVSIAHHASLSFDKANPFSLSIKVKCSSAFSTTTSAFYTLVAKQTGGPSYTGYHLYIYTDKLIYFAMGDNPSFAIVKGSTQVNIDEIRDIVVTYDGSANAAGMKIYLNGVAETLTVVSNVWPATIVNANPLLIGNRGQGDTVLLGYLFSAQVHNRVLTEAEIAYNYRHPNVPIRRGCVLSLVQDQIDKPAAGTWRDTSPQMGNNGTITNATTSKYPAIRGGANALFFPTAAGSDRVDCGNGASLNPATTGLISGEVWVKLPKYLSAEYVAILDKYTGVTGWQLLLSPNYVYVYSDVGIAITGIIMQDLKDNTWKHIVFTHTGGAATGEIYINGINKTWVRTARALSNSATSLYVGNRATFNLAPVGGHIAAARIYNRILSAQEVAYNYTHPDNPIKRGRVLDLSPESLYGSYWYDLSGNANNGTITGAVAKNLGLLTGR